MRLRLRILLSAMMFLEYAVWGAWTPILGATLGDRLNATGAQISWVYMVLWLACILTPFVGGQLVDRYLPSQFFLGVAAVVCTGAAWEMSRQPTIGGLVLWMWVWSLAYAPTLGITNSIAFYHLGREGSSEAEQRRDFVFVRTSGTLGWIVAGLVLSAYLAARPAVPKGVWAPYEEMQVTALFGVLLAVLAFLLPHTPPAKEAADPWAFAKSFTLFRWVPGFTVFVLIMFVVSTEFQFYYVLSAPFLETLGVPHQWLSPAKGISQWAEIPSLGLLLPLALRYLGMRKTLVLGTLAWPLRYFLFALQKPLWLVLVSLSFHGIGYAFVFITCQIYVDRVAPPDIRASAQSLVTLITYGIGSAVGTGFCGWLKDHYTTFVPDPAHPGQQIPGPVDWPMVFLVPGILTLFGAAAFWLTFREPKGPDGPVEEAELKTVGA